MLLQGTRKKFLWIIISVMSVVIIWHSGKHGSQFLIRSENDKTHRNGIFFWRYPDVTSASDKYDSLSRDDTGRHDWSWRYRDHPQVGDKNKWVGVLNMTNVNCSLAFRNDSRNEDFPQTAARWFPYHFTELADDCGALRDRFGFERYPRPSKEEADFPLAFSIIFHKDLDQVVYLLRSIYQPHNAYCLHLDNKATVELMQAARSLCVCLPNVRLASKLYHINYAGFNRLMADVQCMGDLLKSPVQWKYFINLPGQEFPLRTNLEMVRILTLFNGSNDIEGIAEKRRMMSYRFELRHEYIRNKKGELTHERTTKKNPPPPFGFHIVKGSAYGTFSHAFVRYIVYDVQAQALLTWFKHVLSPDEYFWATLHHSGRAPGGYTGWPDKKPWLSAYALWGGTSPTCATGYVRGICIFSPAELSHLKSRHEFFANKFYLTHHPAALHCLDHWIFTKTLAKHTLDMEYYRQLPFVRNTTNRSHGMR